MQQAVTFYYKMEAKKLKTLSSNRLNNILHFLSSTEQNTSDG